MNFTGSFKSYLQKNLKILGPKFNVWPILYDYDDILRGPFTLGF